MARGSGTNSNKYVVSDGSSTTQQQQGYSSYMSSNNSNGTMYNDSNQTVEVVNVPVGIYGWKKYCLYLVILLIVALSFINIGLIVFLFRVVNLDFDSAGPLHFYRDRMLVMGRAEFQGGVSASNISGFDNSTLLVESNERIVLQSYESATSTDKSVVELDGVNVNVDAQQLQMAYQDRVYFSASPQETIIASNDIVVNSPLGLRIDGSVLVPKIENAYERGEGLTIESIGQELNMRGMEGVTLESTTNEVNIRGQRGINLESTGGDIVLDGSNLRLNNLPHGGGSGPRQLCVCGSNGRVYTVQHSSTCKQSSSQFCL
eukprot:m.24229 g.24229  ORF g.24229 m.24229 type:complete len:317 (+) comp9089_c0_seq1:242-1192(+)